MKILPIYLLQVQVDAKGGLQLDGEVLAIYSKERREEGVRRELHCRALQIEPGISPLETGCEKIKEHLASSSQEVRQGRELASAPAS